MVKAKSEFFTITRYAIVGMFNTIIGYGVFVFCYNLLNLHPNIANIIGYGIAIVIAHQLNKTFVFKIKVMSRFLIYKYLSAFALSFILNQLTLYSLVFFYSISPHIAQVFAMIVYTFTFYILNRYFVYQL